MVWPDPPRNGQAGKYDCTLDHRYDKRDPRRRNNGGYHHVAAHFRCNNLRSNGRTPAIRATFQKRDADSAGEQQ